MIIRRIFQYKPLLAAFFLALLSFSTLKAQSQSPVWQWATQSTGNGAGQLLPLAVDTQGNSCGVGFFTGSFRLGETILTSQGRSDMFVAKLSAAGNWELLPKTEGDAKWTPTTSTPPRLGQDHQQIQSCSLYSPAKPATGA